MKQVRVLKIAVASPSDVQAERDMIPAIVDELNKGIADERGVRLEVYRWETDAYPAFHPLGPQGRLIRACALRIATCSLGFFGNVSARRCMTPFWYRARNSACP